MTGVAQNGAGQALLDLFASNPDLSNRELARRSGFDHHYVAGFRAALALTKWGPPDHGGKHGSDLGPTLNDHRALRHIKPGVAHFANEVFCQHPDLLAFMPATTPRQHIWLPLVCWACTRIDADFGAWAARHVPEIPGRTHHVVGSFLSDIADWAYPEKDAGREFITRPFTPSMSLKTTIELSADWHEAVAANLAEGPNATFPAPWYPPARLGDYEILPIEDAATLYREGHAMHHCAGTYSGRVLAGEIYVYSIRRYGERVATLALGRYNSSQASLVQIRGPCNTEPPKAIVATVVRWLDAQRPLPPCKAIEATLGTDLKEVAA